ncbi:hypothetical protein MLD38_021424 [Melastoma candidum]|uniref:Uncharacterized protein n=1 Tax=Melastoma candidum TaxID=119954 RepID=A0ACB9QG45_9MYRT|nr:hypothetical protein MLD38_021424 [Melastoma candidum]
MLSANRLFGYLSTGVGEDLMWSGDSERDVVGAAGFVFCWYCSWSLTVGVWNQCCCDCRLSPELRAHAGERSWPSVILGGGDDLAALVSEGEISWRFSGEEVLIEVGGKLWFHPPSSPWRFAQKKNRGMG